MREVEKLPRRLHHAGVNEIGDKGELFGTHQGSGDANKSLKKIAYASEPARMTAYYPHGKGDIGKTFNLSRF